MAPSPEWLTSGVGLAPRVAWSTALDSELVSLTMARESGDVYAIDRTGGVYWIRRTGQLEGVNRGLKKPRIVRWSDTGDTGLIIEGRDRITLVDDQMNVAWSVTTPGPILATDIDAYGHNLVVCLENGDSIFMNADREKLAQFSTVKPLKHVAFSVADPTLVGAAEHGLICRIDLDGEEIWNERVWTNVGDLSVSGDGKRLFLAEFGHGLHSLDGRGKNQTAYVVEGAPSRVSVSFMGERIATSTLERQLYWLDADGSLLWAAECPDVVQNLICDPLGEWLIVGFESGRILRLDWEG